MSREWNLETGSSFSWKIKVWNHRHRYWLEAFNTQNWCWTLLSETKEREAVFHGSLGWKFSTSFAGSLQLEIVTKWDMSHWDIETSRHKSMRHDICRDTSESVTRHHDTGNIWWGALSSWVATLRPTVMPSILHIIIQQLLSIKSAWCTLCSTAVTRHVVMQM